jgi:hypothetical protein
MTPFRYREQVLSELLRHGLKPDGQTPPEFAREFVNDLYLYEIRSLRKRMRAGLIQKSDYAKLVEELRNRYPILSLPIALWTEPD